MFPDQLITVSYPTEPNTPDHRITWQQFVDHNDDDVVEDVLTQLLVRAYAKIGGGAFPLVWVFA